MQCYNLQIRINALKLALLEDIQVDMISFCSLHYRLPKIVAMHVSLLIPHLGGKAHPLRSAIVTVMGLLIQNAFSDPQEEVADAQGMNCLQTLVLPS